MLLNKQMEEMLPGTPAYADKRRREMEKYDIQLVNQQLQRIMRMLSFADVKEMPTFKNALAKANQKVIQSSILSLSYCKNFENKEVAFATMEFLFEVLPLLGDSNTIRTVLIKLDRPKRLLLPLDSGEMNKISKLEFQLRQNLKNPNQANT